MHPAGDWPTGLDELAERLRALRKSAGLTGEQMAVYLDWPRTKISKIENARQWPSAEDVRRWTSACQAPAQSADLLNLLAVAQAGHRRRRRRAGTRHVGASNRDDPLREATRIRAFEVAVVPALLQTPAYARCLALVGAQDRAADGTAADVAALVRRQDMLYDTSREFTFVLGEGVLRTRVAPAEVLAGQLDRLSALAGLPNVSVAVIPFAAELPVAPRYGFVLADERVLVQTYTAEVALAAADTGVYRGVFDRLAAVAVTGRDADHLIRHAAVGLGAASG